MKKALLLIAIPALFASCGSDSPENPQNDPKDYINTETLLASEANIEYLNDIWKANESDANVVIQGYTFSHSMPYPGYVNGFTPSKLTDLTYYPGQMYLHPYVCIAGPITSGAPYLVGYWDSYSESTATTQDLKSKSCAVYAVNGSPFVPQSVMVANNTYAYYTMLHGDGYAGAFREGSWLKLIAHGIHTDGTEATAECYLAKVESSDAEAGISKTWQTFDLTNLGVVQGIYFTMESSDSGEYGMNTPAYFCLDKLILKD